jgi:LDH2 family malate/lactate/ureidoglycolate dehydrogenase
MKHKHPIPLGWAVGPDGKATTDSKLAFEQGSLMPLGGVQEGHKGYALSLMVEALTGILAGKS